MSSYSLIFFGPKSLDLLLQCEALWRCIQKEGWLAEMPGIWAFESFCNAQLTFVQWVLDAFSWEMVLWFWINLLFFLIVFHGKARFLESRVLCCLLSSWFSSLMVVVPAWLPVQFCVYLLRKLFMQTSSASSLHTKFQDYHKKRNKKFLYCWILQLL